MALRTSHMILPGSNVRINSLHKNITGNGVGAVLLDGGRGGQSSYTSIDDYLETTNHSRARGNGLSDRISSKLSKLNITPPQLTKKAKNITLSI